VAVWTISAQQGTSGRHIAEILAIAADVPLYDGKSLASLAVPTAAMLDFDELERRFSRLNLAGLAFASGMGMPEAIAERAHYQRLSDIARTVIDRAAHAPCVIYLAGAFAVVRDFPNAVHVRIRAPFHWRVANYQREHLLDRHHAEKSIRSDDRLQHSWVRTLWRLDPDDDSHYTTVLDASRLPDDRLVMILLDAAGITRRGAHAGDLWRN
jgi:cytidylate kinase